MGRIKGKTRQQTEKKILKASIDCLSSHGHRNTTFQSIAKKAGVSAASVCYYFSETEEIFPKTLFLIIEKARQKTVKSLISPKAAIRLKEYLQVSFELFLQDEKETKVYFMLYYFGIFDEKIRRLHAQIKETAVLRIESILELGKTQKVFHLENSLESAISIHNLLVGTLLSSLSITTNPDYNKLQKNVIEESLKIAGYLGKR